MKAQAQRVLHYGIVTILSALTFIVTAAIVSTSRQERRENKNRRLAESRHQHELAIAHRTMSQHA